MVNIDPTFQVLNIDLPHDGNVNMYVNYCSPQNENEEERKVGDSCCWLILFFGNTWTCGRESQGTFCVGKSELV